MDTFSIYLDSTFFLFLCPLLFYQPSQLDKTGLSVCGPGGYILMTATKTGPAASTPLTVVLR